MDKMSAICGYCNIEKPKQEFYKIKRKPWCFLCYRAYVKAYHKKDLKKHSERINKWRKNNPTKAKNFSIKSSQKRAQWMKELKTKPCVDCKQTFNPVCMDFDHLPEFEKTINIGRIASNSQESILAEVAKCELVCSNCHRIRTKARCKNKPKTKSYINRIEWYHQLKKGPCADCKGVFQPVCMDFDHLPGFEKLETVAILVRKASAKEVILSEIAKCQLVCSNCHRIRTNARATQKF